MAALYSCNIKSIGRSTHKEGTAGSHIRYIARERAEPELLAHAMPEDPNAARAYLNAEEKADRTNARVVDKIRVALPRSGADGDFSDRQRAELVRDFMQDLTGGKVPWFAAIHQTGPDAHNPHAHIVLRDRDIETGKRVLQMSLSPKRRADADLPGPGAVDWVRERWEHHMNLALERAGREDRVDHRTLEQQGIPRTPQIHVGPNAQHIDKFVERPESQVRSKGKRPNRDPENKLSRDWSWWVSDYEAIDLGRTRRERNQEIIDLNVERGLRSKDFETRAWAQFEKQQGLLDRNLDNQIIPAARKRTLEERRLRQGFKEKLDSERAKRDHDLKLRRNWTRQKFAPTLARLQEQQKEKLQELENRQNRWRNRIWSTLDITGTFRKKQELTKTELLKAQRNARNEFRAEYRDEIEERYKIAQEAAKSKIDTIKTQRRNSLQKFREEYKAVDRKADALLQARENDREQDRRELEKTIADWKRMEKKYDKEQQRAQGQDRGRSRERKRSSGPDFDPS